MLRNKRYIHPHVQERKEIEIKLIFGELGVCLQQGWAINLARGSL